MLVRVRDPVIGASGRLRSTCENHGVGMKLVCLAVLVLPVAAACSNQNTTTPLGQPLMADAREITPDDIYTEGLRQVMSVEADAVIYAVPIEGL
jgi:hypothetical protein